jgi:hypothetical protein
MEYKSPTDILNFVLDHTAELGGANVSTSAFTVEAGLTLDSESNTLTTSTATLSGGIAGTVYKGSCAITASSGEAFEKEFYVLVRRQMIG